MECGESLRRKASDLKILPCRFCSKKEIVIYILLSYNNISFIFGGYDGDSRLNDFHYFLIDERTCEIPVGTLLVDLEALVG